MAALDTTTTHHAPQQGVAAIEFAISILLVLLIFFGIVTYGSLFWMQQKLSHLSADGARYALAESLRYAGTTQQTADKACAYITTTAGKDSLLDTFSPSCTSATVPDVCPQCIRLTVTITDPASIWPVLNILQSIASLIPGAGSDALVPSTLSSSATIQIFSI